MEKYSLPSALIESLAGEEIVFVLHTARRYPVWVVLAYLYFGLFLISLFLLSRYSRYMNFISGITGLVLLVTGIFVFSFAFYILFSEGGLFVGTDRRFVEFRRNKIKAYEWSEFTWRIEVAERGGMGNMIFHLLPRPLPRGLKLWLAKFLHDRIYVLNVEYPGDLRSVCKDMIRKTLTNIELEAEGLS